MDIRRRRVGAPGGAAREGLADISSDSDSLPVGGRPAAPFRHGAGVRDLTTGPIGRTMLMFSLPVMGSNMLQSLNGTANAVWVSHVLGEAALTATSNANTILFLLLGAVFGISMASNLMIGQAVGARDEALIKRIVATSAGFFLLLSIGVGVGGWLLTPSILDAMGTPPDARREAIAYLRVIFLAMPSMYFFSYVMMAQRGAGDARSPFWFSLAAVALDVVLNPILITGFGPAPRLGIAGSALATLTSQTVVLIAMLVYLYRGRSVLMLHRSEWGRLLRPELSIIRNLVLKGLPMAVQMLVVSGAAVAMISMVNGYGSETSAGYAAALQLWTYVQMPGFAIGAAVSAMAAQNVGAGRMDQVNRIAGIGSLQAGLLSAFLIVLVSMLEPLVLRLFLPAGSPAIPIAAHINSIVLWSFIPFGVAFALSGAVRATGAVVMPVIAMLVALWGVRIPVALLLEPRIGADAIWWSFLAGSMVSCLLAGAYFLWGGWRKAKLMAGVPRGQAPDTGLAGMSPEESEAVEAAIR